MQSLEWKPKSSTDYKPDLNLNIPERIQQLLFLRGVAASDYETVLSSSLKNLASPFSLDHMDRAVERLIEAFELQQKICIYADFDLDGTPGLALLLTALKALGFENVQGYQPKRLSEGYGVHISALEKMDIDLLVTVDVGITDIKAVEYANANYIDVIVTDHHLPKETLPEAYAIVNPNKGTCPSGLTYLCGAGVAYYLFLALRSKMKEQGLLEKDVNPKELLDVFTIGTVTDLVPLKNENRTLVKHGLVALENTKRPGLKALLKALKIDGRPLSAQDVGIRFAPKLNALSRMETELLPIHLFTVEDEAEAGDLVRQMLQVNEMRLGLQAEAEAEAAEMVKVSGQKNYAWVASPNFHQGVIGLIATKLSQKLNVPAYVGCIHEDGSVTGSSRSPGPGVSVLAGLDASSDTLVKFGGHAPAAGFELETANIEVFNQSLDKHFNSEQDKEPELPTIDYDLELNLGEINDHFMKWLDHLGPFGKDFEPPLFLIRNANFKTVRELKGAHLKFELGGAGRLLQALWFFPPKEALEKDYTSDQKYELIVELQWNYFAGRKSIQMLIKDLKLAED